VIKITLHLLNPANFARIWHMSGFSRLVLALIILTIAAKVVYDTQMDKVLVIAPSQHFHAVAINDSIDGGHSHADLITTDSSWRLHYIIQAGAPYPYATLSLVPPAQLGFLDLSVYDSVEISIHSMNAPVTSRVRVQLRNVNPAYTDPNRLVTMKYNELQYAPETTPSPACFIWDDFRVPPWWTDMVTVPYTLARTEVTRIAQIDITTPENVAIGDSGTLEVVKLVFRGKQMSATVFYQGLLGLWIFFALGILAHRAWTYSHSLRLQQKREKELMAINDALSIKSREMESMAKKDPLTSLLNRNGLRDHLVGALDRARSCKEPLSVIMVDIDHFKKVNDIQGHARGDEILQAVGHNLLSNTRMHDAVARWGGEEFLILCPATRLETAAMVAEKLRRVIEALPEHVTCSFGVAEWKGEDSIADLIHRADMALYSAKDQGRNQVRAN